MRISTWVLVVLLAAIAAEVDFLPLNSVQGILVSVRATCVSGCQGPGLTVDGEPERVHVSITNATAFPTLPQSHAMAAVVQLPTAGSWRFEAVAFNEFAGGMGRIRNRTLDVQAFAAWSGTTATSTASRP